MNAIDKEYESLINEQNMIKKDLAEQKKSPRRDGTKNIFISGIPNKMDINGVETDNAEEIIKYILENSRAGTSTNSYKILKNFKAREGMDRHCAIIVAQGDSVRKILEGGKKFKNVNKENNHQKNVLLENSFTMNRK